MKYNNLLKLTESFYKEAIRTLSIIKLAGGYYMPDDDEDDEDDLGELNASNMLVKLAEMFDKTTNDLLASYLEAFELTYNQFIQAIASTSSSDEDIEEKTEKIYNLLNVLDAKYKRILTFAPLTSGDWEEFYSPEDVISLIQFIYKEAEDQLKLWTGQEQASIKALGEALASIEMMETTEEVAEAKEIIRRQDVLSRIAKFKEAKLAKRKLARRDPSHPLHESMQKEKAKARERWQAIKADREKWQQIKLRQRNYNRSYYNFDERMQDLQRKINFSDNIEVKEELLKKLEIIRKSKELAESRVQRQAQRNKKIKKLVSIIDPITGEEKKVTDWANVELEGFIKHFSERMASERREIIKVLLKKSDIAKKCQLEIKRLSEAESRGVGSIAEAAANLRRAVRSNLRNPTEEAGELFTGFALSIRYGKSFRKLLLMLRSIKNIPKKLEEIDKGSATTITQEEVDKVYQILNMTKELKNKFSTLELRSRRGNEIKSYFAGNELPLLVRLEPMLVGLHAALSASLGAANPSEEGPESSQILEQNIPNISRLRIQDPNLDIDAEAEAMASEEAAEQAATELRRRSSLRIRSLYSYADTGEYTEYMSPKVREIFESIVEDECNALISEIENEFSE